MVIVSDVALRVGLVMSGLVLMTESITVPLKPFFGVTVIVDEALALCNRIK